MGWFTSENTTLSDIDRGRAAVKEFHNYAIANYSRNYKMTFNELIDRLAGQNKFFLEGLGLAINSTEMSDAKVSKAMRALADKGQGKLPTNWNSWFSVLKDEAVKVSFLDAATYTATESAKDIAHGFKEVGDVTLTTMKSVGVVLPLALTAAVLFVIYNKAKSI